jgi:hypothetical protein
MVKFASILLSLCPLGIVLAAPVRNLGVDTLLQNGQCAQKLNTEFKNMTINDKCKSGDKACVTGALGECNANGAWEVSQCPTNSQCFAVPNKKKEGTKLKCLSEKDALSLIQASGAQGGIFVDNSTDTGNGTDSVPADSGSSNATAEASPSTNDTTAATQTVTVLIAPSTTQTLDAQTTTLDSAGASSLLSSLQGDGVSETSTSSGAEVTGSNSTATETSSGTGGDAQGAAAAAATTILLTAASSSATATSTPAAANAASASASAPPPSNGGYKY